MGSSELERLNSMTRPPDKYSLSADLKRESKQDTPDA
jgi:hypothetical protein